MYQPPSRAKRIVRSIRKSPSIYLLALPGLLILFIFGYVPLYALLVAFKNFNVMKGIMGSEWVGFKNFEYFFTSQMLWPVVRNTLFLNMLFMFFVTVFSVGIAIYLNEIRNRYFKKVAQTFIFFPYFISWIVVGMLVDAFLGGQHPPANELTNALGIAEINWYAEPYIWPWILTLIKVWQGAGYGSIIYLAAIASIPEEMYEAAMIDGASKWMQMTKITLPQLYPTISILTLLAVGRIFNGDFGMIYAIVGDNAMIYPTTDVIDTFVYRAMRQLNDFGMSTAVGLVQSVLGLVFVVGVNAIVRRKNKESALF